MLFAALHGFWQGPSAPHSGQATVYNVRHDGVFKSGLKNSKSIEEVLDAEELRDLLEEMARHVEKPAEPRVAAEELRLSTEVISQEVACWVFSEAQRATVTNLGDAGQEIVKEHYDLARRLVAENVRLIDGSAKDTSIVDGIRSSSVGAIRGSHDGHVSHCQVIW